MGYVNEQFEIAKCDWTPKQGPHDAYSDGLREGFRIALLTYGVWKDGRQVIGCQETPVREIFRKELGDE